MKMNNKNKILGKVYSYDGEAGIILTPDEYYFFHRKDVSGDIKIGDMVEFVSNTFVLADERKNLAFFINKVNIEDTQEK